MKRDIAFDGTPVDPDPIVVPVAPAGTGPVRIGQPLTRIDGPAKVTGRARYAAEHPVAGLLYGVVVNTAVPCGRIDRIGVDEALAVPGVRDVLTHLNRPKMRSTRLLYKDMIAPGGKPFVPLHDDRVVYSGQPVALVVADSFEAARHAAGLVHVACTEAPHQTNLLDHLDRPHTPSRLKAGYTPPESRGDADVAMVEAAVRIAGRYHAGTEHHNPMEMHATTVLRGADGHLTIYDKSQGSQNCRWVVSRAFGLGKDKVTVRNPYVGGAFGSGLRPNYVLLLAVMAALHLKASVRVVLTRQQMFTFGHRPETLQHLALGADTDGTLRAIVHEAVGATSRYEDYSEAVVNWSGQLYRCDNVRQGYQVVALDQATPMDMRAPGATHGVHALEVAMDELAHALGMCPLALRLKNYAEVDPSGGLPFSSKTLRECYRLGAERFGWPRAPTPRSRREGHEWVGWGMATGTWDALQMFARARAVLHEDGRLVVSTAASDIGTGTYTAMSQIAAATLGLPLEQVRFELGDSTLPVAPVEGGSAHMATVGSAVEGVCEKLGQALWKLARRHDPRFAKAEWPEVLFEDGALRLKADRQVSMRPAALLRLAGETTLEASYLLLPNLLKQRKFVRATHSAVFCEVRVDEDLGAVRVTRVVSAIDAGRIVNPLAARSQIIGGVVWGIGHALHEDTLADHALGRFMNHSFAEYHVPVQADVPDIDVIFAEQHDGVVSRIGAKGVGEIGLVGVAAAISNAIFHATGRRLRSTPMTPDKVMRPETDDRG